MIGIDNGFLFVRYNQDTTSRILSFRLGLMKIAALLLIGFSSFASWRWMQQAPTSPPTAKNTAMANARQICTVADVRLDESSGMGASRRYPGCWWLHNDSGDEPRLFLINEQGKSLAVVNLPGAHSDDWEDMAVAGSGTNAWIYVGDMGDNLEVRPDITIYRLREPQINTQSTLVPTLSARFEKMTLRYPDGAHNAETLMANARGELLLVTKTSGESQFFVTTQPFLDGSKQTLKRIGAHQFGSTEPGNRAVRNRLTTAGDLSPDGRRLIISTYAQTHEWTLPEQRWESLFQSAPRTQNLPPLKQCEAIAYSADGKRTVVSSEGAPCPLWELTPNPNR
jgi:hypothetical protein